jgi:cytochrome c oxidase assembly protein subunit 15
MTAGTVAILILLLAIWLFRREPRRWVVRLGFAALAAVLLQALLGGLTVLFLLPPAISIAHACLAQTVFCLTVTIALVTSRGWRAAAAAPPTLDVLEPAASEAQRRRMSRGSTSRSADDRAADPRGPESAAQPAPAIDEAALHSGPARLAIVMVGAVFVQLVLGAVLRHTGAGLAIPDFPLAFGRLIPPTWSGPIALHFAHRIQSLVVLFFGILLASGLLHRHGRRSDLARPAILLSGLLPVQIALGGMTVLLQKPVSVTVAHVATGALILATSLVIALRAWRVERAPTPLPAVTAEPGPLPPATGRPLAV